MINQAQSLKNPTFRWTLAQMYDELFLELTAKQRTQFIIEIQNNLNLGDDWIMLSQSMKALQKALNYGFNIKSIKSRLLALKNHKSKVVRTHAAKLMLRIQSS
jgi:hypothetical protein